MGQGKRPPAPPSPSSPSSGGLSRESLAAMRRAVEAIADGRRQGIVELAAAAPSTRVTVDFDAREDLGHPLVVVQAGAPRPPWWDALSEREREVANLVAGGLSNAEIAGALFISVATVKDHVHHVLHKAQATRRSQIAAALR